MKLEHSITVMNSFMNTSHQMHGSTPAKFVEEYMARNDATLTNYPVDEPNYSSMLITNNQSIYQQQRDLLLSRRTSYDIQQPTNNDWDSLTTLEGRAFSQDGISLSKQMINQEAKSMQQAFDQGHTVLTLVTSFDNEYLKSLNIEKQHASDFHYDIDEMKLRLAVKKGCQTLTETLGYTKPLFIGSIQLDRDHPHAHIAMCETASREKSNAKFFYDGHEWGTLSKSDRNSMRQSINNELEFSQKLNFMPSNQVEQAQKSAQLYSNKFANLKEQKQMILASALNSQPAQTAHEKAMSEELVLDLTDELAHKSKQQRAKIRNKIRHKMNINKNSSKRLKLPLLINLQLQRITTLMQSKKRSARLVARLKRAKEKERKAKEKEYELAAEYQKIKKFEADHPEQSYIIESHIIPYYQNALNNVALTIDQQRQHQFQPINEIPNSIKSDFNDLRASLALATTPFEKAEAQQRAFNATINWHQKGWITSLGIQKAVKLNLDVNTMPKPSAYPLADIKPIKYNPYQANEKILLIDAEKYVDALPNDELTKQIKNNLKIKKEQLASNQNIHNNQATQYKENKTPNKIKQYYSINYHEADNTLLDCVN